MAEIELFLQGEGIPQIVLIRVPEDAVVRDIVEVARVHGLRSDGADEVVVFLEGNEEPLALELAFSTVGISSQGRVHVHRHRRIDVTVNFNAEHMVHAFSPATTLHAVKARADHRFGLTGVDATDHALQVCGTTNRPPDDVHIGSLTPPHSHTLCLDLVPKKRVEG